MSGAADPGGAGFEELRRTVRRMEERLARVEALVVGGAAPAAAASVAALEPAPAAPPPFPADALRAVTYSGRLLLVFAGAYLLRALTEGGTLPGLVGAGVGFAYALLWLFAAHRAGRRGQALAAAFHGAATALIAYPLAWEAATRFQLVSTPWAAVAVGFVAAAALAVALRDDLKGLAWLASAGALVISALLIVRPDGVVAVGLLFVLLGAATLVCAARRAWPLLPWVTAAAADAAVFYVTTVALGPRTTVAPGAALAVQGALVVLYLGAFTRDLLVHGHPVRVFHVAQTVVVLAVGFRGALDVADATGTARLPLGLLSLAAAVAAYFAAFRLVPRSRRPQFFWFTTVAFVLVIVGSLRVLDRPALPWALLSVATSALGSRFGRVLVSLHGVAFAAAAALASGLLRGATAAWTALPTAAWPDLPASAWLSLAALASAAWLTARTDNPWWKEFAVLPRAVALALFSFASTGALLYPVATLLAGPAGPDRDPAALAVVRTGVLALATLLAAVVGRTARLRPAAWLVWPLLAAGPLKLVLEDLPRGRPSTLWISFLLYGSVLIVAPRLARSRAAAPAAPAEPAS